MIGWIIFIFFMVIIVIVAIVIAVIKFRGVSTSTIPPNATFFKSFDQEKADGHTTGIILKESSKNGETVNMKIRPLDIPYDNKGNVGEITNQKFAIRKELILRLSAGSNSLYRNEVYIFPDNSAKLNKELRNSPFGRALNLVTEELVLTDKAVQMIRENRDNERNIMTQLEPEMNKLTEIYEETLKRMIKEKASEEKGKE